MSILEKKRTTYWPACDNNKHNFVISITTLSTYSWKYQHDIMIQKKQTLCTYHSIIGKKMHLIPKYIPDILISYIHNNAIEYIHQNFNMLECCYKKSHHNIFDTYHRSIFLSFFQTVSCFIHNKLHLSWASLKRNVPHTDLPVITTNITLLYP